jgi:hypothetical protein
VILLDQIAVNAVAKSVTAPTEFVPYKQLDTPEKMEDFKVDYCLPERFVRGGNYDGLIALWCLDRELTEKRSSRIMEALR